MDHLLCNNPDICNMLGVTHEKGTCQRHPNIVIYQTNKTKTVKKSSSRKVAGKASSNKSIGGGGSSSSEKSMGGGSTSSSTKSTTSVGSVGSNRSLTTVTTTNIEIACCRICDSEMKAGGRKQRKTFANLINDIKGMHDTQEWAEYKLMTWGEEEHVVEGTKVVTDIDIDGTTTLEGISEEGATDGGEGNNENNQELRISKVGTPTSLQLDAWQDGENGLISSPPQEGKEGEGNGEGGYLLSEETRDNDSQTKLKVPKSKQPSIDLVFKLQQDQRNILKEEFKNYVEIRDRTKKFKTYKQVFVCSEAVDFMVNNGYASTRSEAVKLGKRLQHKFKIFDHITHKATKRDFADEYLFFRFFDDEESTSIDDDFGIDSDDSDDDDDDDNKEGNIYDENNDKTGTGDNGGGGGGGGGDGGADSQRSIKNDSTRTDITLTQDALEKYAKKFKQYVEVMDLMKDRTYLLRKYKNCFIGKEAVDFMVDQGYAKSRSHAVKLGRALQKRLKLFEHVTQDHDFDDQHWYYRFCDNTKSGLSSDDDEELDIVDESGLFEIVTQETLEDLAKEFKSHADVQDRQYKLKTYPQCFVASEAVDFMCNLGYARSRIEAVKMGKALQYRLKLFEHVTKDHKFCDEYLFFQFCKDNEAEVDESTTSFKKHSKTGKILKKSAKSVKRAFSGSKTENVDTKMKLKIEESLSYDKDKEKDGRSGMKVKFEGVSQRSDRPMASGPWPGSSVSGLLSSAPSQRAIETVMTVNEEFMVSIAKRAAQVSAWAKKAISDEELEAKEQAQREANERNDKLKQELHQAKEDSSRMIFNLEAILQSKDTTIDELQAKIDRQERQIIYELRMIAATKRARAKKEKEQLSGTAMDSTRSIELQDRNDIAATQVDKAKFDLATAQEMASQKEATLKATIQVQSAAMTELQLKYDKQQYELEELQKRATGRESFEAETYSTSHTSNANLVNQLEKLKRDRKSEEEEFAKKEKELQSLIQEHIQQNDIHKANCQTLQKKLDDNKKTVERNIVEDLRILAKAKIRKQKEEQQQRQHKNT